MKIATLFFILSIFQLSDICARDPPMVEKRIFSSVPDDKPEEAQKKTPNKEDIKPKLKNELVFTGIVITDKDRYALLKDKKDPSKKSVKREGDTLLDLKVKKIEPTYVLLTEEDGKETRYNLYQADRARPAALPLPVQQPGADKPAAPNAAGGKPENVKQLPGPGTQPGVPASPPANPASPGNAKTPDGNEKQKNPFTNAFKKFQEDRSKGVVSPPLSPDNPFKRALNKAMGQ